jgi:adenine-specific DNA-methyltransferase
MGSKRVMLKGKLGHLLTSTIPKYERFVDLFSGTGAVASYVAENYDIEVIACDLQKYSSIITAATICRTKKLDANAIWKEWHERAYIIYSKQKFPKLPKAFGKRYVLDSRKWSHNSEFPITRAYGGHYYSIRQSTWIDALRITVPEPKLQRTLALASLIQAASKCAAAPGHTAQPFQPTSTALAYIKYFWDRDILDYTKNSLLDLASLHAMKRGRAVVGDANIIAAKLTKMDLAFIDPPYSGVHYSRFYHVLETIAHGECGDVAGIGRYPDRSRRPQSEYSTKTHAFSAIQDLLETLSTCKAEAIVTFPNHMCSNGVSGEMIKKYAKKLFNVRTISVKSNFSTLGGMANHLQKGYGRSARQDATEMILYLTTK